MEALKVDRFSDHLSDFSDFDTEQGFDDLLFPLVCGRPHTFHVFDDILVILDDGVSKVCVIGFRSVIFGFH